MELFKHVQVLKVKNVSSGWLKKLQNDSPKDSTAGNCQGFKYFTAFEGNIK